MLIVRTRFLMFRISDEVIIVKFILLYSYCNNYQQINNYTKSDIKKIIIIRNILTHAYNVLLLFREMLICCYHEN